MPVCKCGVKVDRLQNNLQCLICKQFFHLHCCNITEVDYEFINKEAFKCASCLRRSSMDSNNVVNSAEIDAPCAKLVVTDNATDVVAPGTASCTNAHTLHADTNVGLLLNLSCERENSSENECLASAHSTGVTLETIFAELIALKRSNALLLSSNESLSALVTSLRDENANIVSKVNVMQSSIDKMDDALKKVSLDVSPKRKKLGVVNANSTALKPLQMPLSDPNIASKSSNTLVNLPISMPSTPAMCSIFCFYCFGGCVSTKQFSHC